MPAEMIVLKMAEHFGVLPDDIENKVSKRWYDLWLVYIEEVNRGK